MEFLFSSDLVHGAVLALVASAAVRALPVPADGGNKFYLWFYNFTHILLANFDKLRSTTHADNKPSNA